MTTCVSTCTPTHYLLWTHTLLPAAVLILVLHSSCAHHRTLVGGESSGWRLGLRQGCRLTVRVQTCMWRSSVPCPCPCLLLGSHSLSLMTR
jgi:hypothetical protein